MRKRVTVPATSEKAKVHGEWLNLEEIAEVELTSEDPAFPIENALDPDNNVASGKPGWRAAALGPQTITINFDQPQQIRRVVVQFDEREHERSQEFALFYSSATEKKREIVRQQWSFSAQGSTIELEDYAVNLQGVTSLELTIDPDRGRDRIPATLTELRVE